MMRSIHLYGPLGDKYGRIHRLDVETVPEAIRAMSTNFETFGRDIGSGTWHVIIGKTKDDGLSLSVDEMDGFGLGRNDIHILPALEGAKNGGLMKAVLGVALMGLSFGFGGVGFMANAVSTPLFGAAFTWGNLAGTMGMTLALAGASSLLAPQEKDETKDESFVMTGPTNTTREGAIVPIVYGKVITGGVLISGGIDIEQIVKEEEEPEQEVPDQLNDFEDNERSD